MAIKKKYEIIKTPAGTAVWPKLTKPDTKFNADGVFSTKLRIPAEEAQGLIQKLNEIHQANLSEQTKIAKKKVKEAALPWVEVLDEDGNETGDLEFNFKRVAKVTTKDGKKFDVKIPLFDSQNQPLEDVDVWGGSTIVIAAEVVPYYTAMVGAGLSLRLKAVQVKKLVQGGAGGNAEAFGFESEDGGYVAPKKQTFDAATEDDPEDEDF